MKAWQKICVTLISILGVALVAYGMTYDNNVIFVIGLILVASAYGVIRVFLKESIDKP